MATALETAEPAIPKALAPLVEGSAWEGVARMIAADANTPATTSAGRLFDAVAALCGVRATVIHEGQAAAELEGRADPRTRERYEMGELLGDDGRRVIDPRETIRRILADVASGVDPAVVAARFHNGLAAALTRACVREAERLGRVPVVLSGGVFQNRLLVARTAGGLREAGMVPLLPMRLPPNDGQVSYGQAAVAAARDAIGSAEGSSP
jgi:hydrogenase maturation protein HypF